MIQLGSVEIDVVHSGGIVAIVQEIVRLKEDETILRQENRQMDPQ